MSAANETSSRDLVLRSLRALGGEATLGDLLAVTALPRVDVERAMDALIARGQGHVRVLEHGDVVFHLSGGSVWASPFSAGWAPHPRRTAFDRKILQVIRARQGVLSLAELVEQTGLPLRDAEVEMRRLVESWGGESRPGLDGHRVYVFRELMRSTHGRFPTREPRPAWVRAEDPTDHAGWRRRRTRTGIAASGVGVAALVASIPAGTLVGAVLGSALLTVGLGAVVRYHPRFRFRQADTLRRYALGYVVETALRGKGVVSLDRTIGFIQSRAGRRRVSRRQLEKAMRALAEEFDAPITREGDDTFFGFRNVKRQFLASHLERRHLALGGTVFGRTVFDTADPPLAAFDRELALGAPDGEAPMPPRPAGA